MTTHRAANSAASPPIGARWRKRLLAGLALASLVTAAGGAYAAQYQLGPQDKVRLKIYEWRASRDTIFEWTALNDQFIVGADGYLSLPFAGHVQAAGMTPDDLSKSIGDRLQEQMGLGRAPDVAVEVVQYRPFFIVGNVTQPGEFPYRPGLNVLQAVSISGGLQRREEGYSRLEREVIAGKGEVSVYAVQSLQLTARKARLEAELNNADQVTFPDQLLQRKSDPTVALVMDQERSIFQQRRQALNTQVTALTGLRDFLEKELSSLETQLTFHDKQVELIQKELSGVSTLVTKGFAAAPRELGLERDLASIQSGRLEAETSLLRARQEISRTDLSILELKNTRSNEVAISLRETQASLEELGRKADTAVQLLHESEISQPRLLALRQQAAKTQPNYTIIRPQGEGTTQITATETTEVLPGDTVKVELPMPLGLEEFQTSNSDFSIGGSSGASRPTSQAMATTSGATQ